MRRRPPITPSQPLRAPKVQPEILPPAQIPKADQGLIVKPSAPFFRFEVWCSVTGNPFIAVAERHGDALYIIGNVRPTGEVAKPGRASDWDYYAIDAHPEWRCPWCSARESSTHDFLSLVWACQEPLCGEPLHCCGSENGEFRCACGMRTRREFHRADEFEVRRYHGLRGASGRGDAHPWPYSGASTGTLLRRRAISTQDSSPYEDP